MRHALSAAVSAVLLSIVLPRAAEAQAGPRDCGSLRTQTEMNACAAEDYRVADAELNRVYGELRARLDPRRRQVLVVAERAWLRYRDAHCAFAGSEVEGGSMQPLVVASCRAAATRARTAELRAALQTASR
jgi:uncharacterized protein YecT (DUF1311 family)